MLILPIGHDKAIYERPWFTLSVLGLCVALQILAGLLPAGSLASLAYVPADGISLGLFTSQFVHAGFLHLAGNMLFLWLTGANMEFRWGVRAWAATYLLGGAVAAFVFGLLHPGSTVPLVGASGAIAAAMGAFLVCLARTRIRFWYAYFLLLRFGTGKFTAPAYVALPMWFLGELFNTYTVEGASGVAYSAHVAGFVFGASVALVLRTTGLEDKLRAHIGSDVFDDEAELFKVKLPSEHPKRPKRNVFTHSPTYSLADALPKADPGTSSAMPGGLPSLLPTPAAQPYPPRARSYPPPPKVPSLEPPRLLASPDDFEDIANADFGVLQLDGTAPEEGPTAAEAEADAGESLSFEQLLASGDRERVHDPASRQLEQLARENAGEPGRVRDAFQRIADRFEPPLPLTDRALAIVVRYCASAGDMHQGLAATRALITQYPHSRHTPGAMLESARLQRGGGHPAKADRTLRNIVIAYPGSPAATHASEELAGGAAS